MKKTYSGQGLSEYSLIAALVGIAVCVALAPLGQSIAGLFSNILGNSKTNTVAITQNSKAEASSMEKSISSISSGTKSALASLSNENDNNSKVTTQTVGASGTSAQVYADANKIQQIANQLKQEGADPGLIDILTRLANAGHSLGDTIAAEDQKVVFNMNVDPMNAAQSNFENIRLELNSYLQNQPNLISSTQWSTINQHADNISESPVVWGESKNAEFESGNFSGNSSTVSQTVHQSSNTICNNGGNSSDCRR